MIDPVRPIELVDVEEQRERIPAPSQRRLVRLDLGNTAPEMWLKLENLQPINAYKIRGAANAVALLCPMSSVRRACGRSARATRGRGLPMPRGSSESRAPWL